MITFRDVSKTYPDGTTAVNRISLDIPGGKVTVFVGPSGCGKTTSLRMINRMVEPSTGEVAIDGADVRSVDAARLRRGIGYVIQSVGLFPHRTVLDNIATVPVLTGSSRREARAAATELMERVGLPASIGARYPNQLSGGQQQRVGVARALAADPPVLLMDEPFSAVDPVVRAQLQQELLRLQGDLGKTIVFVTHDIDEALTLGDLIVIFRPGGHIAQVASPSGLLRQPADDFVADFIGHDRGYRALSFTPAGGLPITAAPTVALDRVLATAGDGNDGDLAGQDTPHGARANAAAAPVAAPLTAAELQSVGGERWILLVDTDRRPRGWLDLTRARNGDGIHRTDIRLGGSLLTPDGSLRSALDAALSSPSGQGVVVDADVRLIGTVSTADVLAAIEAAGRGDPAAAAHTVGPGRPDRDRPDLVQ